MKTKQMNGIKEVRTMLGLSQVKLAEYLGIPRSNLAMAERDKRMLKASNLLKLADLQVKINNSRIESKTKVESKRVDRIEILSRQDMRGENTNFEISLNVVRMEEARAKCNLYTLYEKLDSMSNEYDLLQQWLASTEDLIAIYKDSEPEAEFWNREHDRILSKLNRCSLLKQDQLRLKIKVLETESQYHK